MHCGKVNRPVALAGLAERVAEVQSEALSHRQIGSDQSGRNADAGDSAEGRRHGAKRGLEHRTTGQLDGQPVKVVAGQVVDQRVEAHRRREFVAESHEGQRDTRQHAEVDIECLGRTCAVRHYRIAG